MTQVSAGLVSNFGTPAAATAALSSASISVSSVALPPPSHSDRDGSSSTPLILGTALGGGAALLLTLVLCAQRRSRSAELTPVWKQGSGSAAMKLRQRASLFSRGGAPAKDKSWLKKGGEGSTKQALMYKTHQAQQQQATFTAAI